MSSSPEEVILAEDEADGEQRHPFDGNCSEPGWVGVGPGRDQSSQGWASRPLRLRDPQGVGVQDLVTQRRNTRAHQAQEETGNGGNLLP